MLYVRLLNIFVISSLIIVFSTTFAQNTDSTKISSNFEIFENALRKTYKSVEDEIILHGIDKVYYFRIDAKNEINDFFINGARRFLSNYKIITEDSGKQDFTIFLKDIVLKTDYQKMKPDLLLGKKVKRKIILSYYFSVKNVTDEKNVFSKKLSEIFEDELSYDDIEIAEASGYNFTKGQLPQETLFEKLLVPGIAVITSAAAIILFFVIRSK